MTESPGATSFSAAPATTAGLFAALFVAAVLFAWGAQALWQNVLIAGLLLAPALLCGLGAAILAYRLVVRPTMLRVGPDGIFIKRLAVTIPWQALARVERIERNGETLFSLIEAEGGHPVFDERGLLLGAALNQKAGLPPLAVTMTAYDGTPEQFEAAVRAQGRVDLVAAGGETAPEAS